MIRWTDENGGDVETIFTSIGQEVDLIAHVTVPEDAVPGVYDLRIDVNGKAPNNFPADRILKIQVMNKLELEIIPEFSEATIPADNISRIVEIVSINHGNSEEAFDLFVTADLSMKAQLSTPSTGD